MAYTDWQDHDDHDDGGYVDHHDHSDSDCDYTDWVDHDDAAHGDWDDYNDGSDHSDWDDHTDGGHTDWDDSFEHEDGFYVDWLDHGDAGNPHVDWTDAHIDWTNAGPHLDWTDHGDLSPPHQDWDDGHADWDDSFEHEDGVYVDWLDHNDSGNPHEDWTDSHTDWGDGVHGDWTDHDDGGGGAHGDWTDVYGDYSDHDDGPHIDWTNHADGGHSDWDDHTDTGGDVTKTRVNAWIGGKDVSCYIIGADIWRDALNGVGRWELILDNQGHWWGGAFAVDDDVTIHINGSLMMMGYVDDISPFIDSKGEYTEFIKVSGRDYGMDLAQLFISQGYENRRADNIVDLALALAVSEITYVSPSAASRIDYEFDRTYLADGIRDIAKLVDYDYYVQDDVNQTLHFFDIATMGGGAEHTAVNLTSVAGSATNNILRLEIGEGIGFDVKNYIETHAGDLNDHYTDLNAADFAAPANVTITDDNFFFLRGKGAIRATTTADNTPLYMDLTFPRYDHTVLDLSENGTGRYIALPHDTTFIFKETGLRLLDNAGNWIQWFVSTLFTGVPRHETTINDRNDAWRFIEFPYGDDTDIRPAPAPGIRVNGFWNYVAPAVAFDWANIVTIRFVGDVWAGGQNLGDYIVYDGLEIPAVEVLSVQQDAPSIAAYGTRMKEIYRPDIKNQMELDAFATDQLPKYSDPVQSVTITAIGQVDSNYAAQSLDVQAPSSGIAALTPYRIFTLHHTVKLSPLQNEIAGYDYITEYELVKSAISGTDQPIEPTRVSVTHSPTRSMMRRLREQGRYNQTIRKIR